MNHNAVSRWLDAPETVEEEKDALSLFAKVMTNILLFFLIFGLSASVRIQDLRHQLTNRLALCTGFAMQFLVTPLLGYVAVMLFKGRGLTYAMGITLLVLTSSPGGSYSNWWCNLFNAELALSVAMTSVSSILSLGLLPANLIFYSWLTYSVGSGTVDEDRDVIGAIDFKAIFITLGVVLSAIILGLYTGYKSNHPSFHEYANQFGNLCGICLIIFSTFLGGGGGEAETNFWSLNWSFYIAVALPCLGGVIITTFGSRCFRLTPPEVVAISVECCCHNIAIATSVAITMFDDPDERAEAVSVPLFYGFIEAIIVGVYCVVAWKVGWTKAPPDEKLCVVMTKSYQGGMEDGGRELEGAELPKSWFKLLFIPKKVEAELRSPAATDESLTVKTDVKNVLRRFESVESTVSTTVSSTPGTLIDSPTVDRSIDSGPISDVELQELAQGCRLFDSQYSIEETAEEVASPDNKGSENQ